MKIILLFLALLLMVIGCDDKQNVYQKGDIVFDAQGFPYYYGVKMGSMPKVRGKCRYVIMSEKQLQKCRDTYKETYYLD